MGRESYPTSILPVQKEMELMCVAFPCKTLDLYNLIYPRNYNLLNSLDVLEAESNSVPSVYGTTLAETVRPWISFFAPTASIFVQPDKRLKVTAGAGAAQKRMLLLNVPEKTPPGQLFNTGSGFDVDTAPAIHHTYLQSATDMWCLDDSRVQFFGRHGIENARVNTLHKLAGEAIGLARQALDNLEYQEYLIQARRALGLESRAYPDVVGMANDVVRGLVFYLVLLLPFAFTMERLFLAGRRIETRIAGIVAVFLAMFLLLRFTHPAFRIVLSPMVVLLGFAVAALSVVIVSIVMSKLEALVSRRKLEEQGEHESGVQAVSGFALALELGIANMRQRRARTKFTSLVKVELFMLPICLVCSLLFWAFFWHIESIPSSTYPFTAKMWPLQATYQCLFMTATTGENSWLIQSIRPSYILGSVGFGFLLLGITTIAGLPALFFYGMIGGLGAIPNAAIPMFLGAVIGRRVFEPRYGRETWRRYTPVLAAGYACGVGLIVMLSVAFAMVAKSVSSLPF